MTTTLTITREQEGQRLDLLCVRELKTLSRSAVQKAIKQGYIRLNGQETRSKQVVHAGDVITASIPAELTPVVASQPQDLAIPILYEDKDIVVINKPAGVSVYPGLKDSPQPTIASWFSKRYASLGQIGPEAIRSGIIHRLDKDTSGILILAKTDEALGIISKQFKREHVRKEYVALVFGVPSMKDGRINQPLSRSKRNPMRRTIDPTGRPAITEWKIEQTFGDDFALLRVFPQTGRMHQIRAHLHFISHPIVGDALYTFKRQRPPKGVSRQLLHAEKIGFKMIDGTRKNFVAPLAEDFKKVLTTLRDGI